jgi:hypothetical protein
MTTANVRVHAAAHTNLSMLFCSAATALQLPPTDRVEGVPLGTRVLMQLLASVAHLAGPEAAARLTLLIHCSDSQQVGGAKMWWMSRPHMCVRAQQAGSWFTFSWEGRLHCHRNSTATACSPRVGGMTCPSSPGHLQGEVLSDLWSRRHYGLAPENVIIMPQPAWPGHRFDKAGQRWVRDALGPYHSLGTGGWGLSDAAGGDVIMAMWEHIRHSCSWASLG